MNAPTDTLDATLGALLNLQKRFCTASTLEEFHYSVVNEVIYLVSYRQAALWRSGWGGRSGGIDALSGLPILDRDVPLVQWLTSVCRYLEGRAIQNATPITLSDLPPDLGSSWHEWLSQHGLWLPVALPGNATPPTVPPVGGVLLAREEPWTPAEQLILEQLGVTMAPVWWGLLARRSPWRRLREKWPRARQLLVVILLLGLALVPMRQSVLAPGEVVAHAPVVVRAAIDGVVDEFYVTPNETVKVGQLLLRLDSKKLDNLLAVTQ
ncbi:MAG TPA: biotin/lipoyl-binding protein, partial [Magnetococcales bacterium]|nr:biotin/lipoyl-binding protein [Magnetococcales bacterium]